MPFSLAQTVPTVKPPTPSGQAKPATPVPMTPQAAMSFAGGHEAIQSYPGSMMADALGQMSALQNQYSGAQANLDRNYYNAQSGHLTDAYNNNLALLDQDRYRNVDLGQRTNNENRRYITQTWQNLQNYLSARTRNAAGVWGNQDRFYREMAPLDFRTLGLQKQENLYNTHRDLTDMQSDATARGAMSSRGHQFGRFNRESLSRNQANQFENQYDIRRLQADTQHRGDRLSYQAALDAIANERATGHNTYTHGITGADIQDAALASLSTTYGLRADQLGIQNAQAQAGNRRSLDALGLESAYNMTGLNDSLSTLERAMRAMGLM